MDIEKVQGGKMGPMVSSGALKDAPIIGIYAPSIVDLRMLNDDDNEDMDMVKVPILDEYNLDKGGSLSVRPLPEGTSLATNVVEKVSMV
jgi:hypothetical protein